MKFKMAVLIAAYLPLVCVPSARASTLYATSHLPPLLSGGTFFYSVNQNTAIPSTISSNTFADDLASDWRPDSYRIWSIYGTVLTQIDPTTGIQTVAPFLSEGVSALAFDVTTGTLYGVGTSRGNLLLKINPTTGVTTIIGNTGFDHYTSLAADLSGALFGVTINNILVRIDPTTGLGQSVATVVAGIEDLAVRPENGVMFGVRNLPVNSKSAYELLTIDTTTGATTPVGDVQLNHVLSGLAFSPAVPEPTAIALVAIATIFVAPRSLRRRNKVH